MNPCSDFWGAGVYLWGGGRFRRGALRLKRKGESLPICRSRREALALETKSEKPFWSCSPGLVRGGRPSLREVAGPRRRLLPRLWRRRRRDSTHQNGFVRVGPRVLGIVPTALHVRRCERPTGFWTLRPCPNRDFQDQLLLSF